MRDLQAGQRIKGTVQPVQHARIVDDLAGQPDAFIEPHQMGRSEDMHLEARRLGHGAHESRGRTFAIGAGDVNDRRQPVLWTTQCLERRLDPSERQLNRFWI